MLPAPLLACLLLAARLATAADCAIDHSSPDLSWEAKLQKDLASRCPESRHRSPSGGNATVVKVKIFLKGLYVHEGEEAFSIVTWLLLGWLDPRMSWDPKAYGGIDDAVMMSSDVWTPPIKLQNSINPFEIFSNTECIVKYTGSLHCKSWKWHAVACVPRLTEWPHETRTCRFELGVGGAAGAAGGNVSLAWLGKRGVSMLATEYGPVWNIVDYAQEEHTGRGSQLAFALTLQRQGASLRALAVWPALALSALTLSAPMLDAGGAHRAPLAAFSLLAHFTMLLIISNTIPKRGHDAPIILMYLQYSIIITVTNIIITYFLKYLSKKTSAPEWVVSMNGRVSHTPIRFLLRWRPPRHSVAEAVSNRQQAEWRDFVGACDAVLFVAQSVGYCVLYSVCIPKPPSDS